MMEEDDVDEAPRPRVVFGDDSAGTRLDKALAEALPDLSRSRLKALMEQGAVTLDGATITDAGVRVKPGWVVEVAIPAPEAAEPIAQDIPLSVVFEDDHLLVIDKRAGMVVHPAAGNLDGTLVNALLAHCGEGLSGVGGVKRPGIVHRLDKDTSGLMVVAKNDRAHVGLSEQFADRTLGRTYRALVWGVPMPSKGRVEGNIARSSNDRKKMAVVPPPAGKHAATRYTVLKRFGTGAAWVECALETGRTHQIRVHMAHIGHPLVGDDIYGQGRVGRASGANARSFSPEIRHALAQFPRQALHAVEIHFRHPITGIVMSFTAEVPSDIENLLNCLEGV